eukprot:TRINITY_DN67385_c0_g1_i1.p3 TRINITY_DN67385_c0_g1~~TRINITY_DN67385_c0_g1_i1.p3  ORF type:complete len:186 (-),score=82.76 TRINITY_DN67385_c0_g1_i1:60-617(-)
MALEMRKQLASAQAAKKEALRELCKQQEERAKALEVLQGKKEEQLLKLHTRLEESLIVLQAGQHMYTEQQQLLDEQSARINALCQRCSLGKQSPSKTGRSAVGNGSDDLAEYADRAEELKTKVLQLGAARNPASPAVHPAASGEAESVLARLQALLAEKQQLQQDLLEEQAAVDRQLRELEATGA